MTVTPYQATLFHNPKQLHQLLLDCKKTLLDKTQKKVVSISLKTQPLDPLAVLQKIANPGQLHFYIEKPNQGEAIAAIDAALQLKLEGKQRFAQAQAFIDASLGDTITTGDLHLPLSGPHFFCSFTFFADNLAANSPFPANTIFLPRWQVACRQDCAVIVANLVIDSQINLEKLIKQASQDFKLIKSLENQPVNLIRPLAIQKLSGQNIAANQANFKSSAISALESIHAKQINKIVLASAIDITSPTPLHPIDSLNNLRKSHRDCFVFSTSNGKGKTFIGASPERLIRIHNQELETDALAGSAPRGKTAAEDAYFADALLSSEKEQREHQLVSNFIVERLSSLGLIPQRLPLPCLLQLSNIQHLWTPIRAKVSANVHPLEIVAELHPTPAVAGDPRDIAMEQIRRYESFERCLYAAPLGWIDHRGNCEFIVGIRSALIDGSNARLYAGAGIVAGSDPDKELAEIQLKLQALLKALV